MQRIAYQLRIKQDKIEEYEREHQQVWPELLAELEFFGVSDYSIFRRGQQLFLYFHVPDFALLEGRLAKSEVNLRWQQKMAPFWEPVLDLQPSETQAMMKEVFYMAGKKQ